MKSYTNMRKLLFSLSILFLIQFANAQELNCTVVINAEQTGRQNEQIFKTLKKSVTDFMNNTVWTDKVFGGQERINCSMMITVSDYSVSTFNATLQVQSSRPVFNSTYSSPVLNFNDKDFQFDYVEFQNMALNKNQFDSNLISVLSYYAYMIIGMDADTFKLNGGNEYYSIAQNIVSVAQTSGYKGWATTDRKSRYELITQLQSPALKDFRGILYRYHLYALDQMADNQKTAKERLAGVISQFSKLHKRIPNNFLQRTFFDAKSDEIADIFTDGPSVKITDMVDVLNNVSSNNSSKWSTIKY